MNLIIKALEKCHDLFKLTRSLDEYQVIRSEHEYQESLTMAWQDILSSKN